MTLVSEIPGFRDATELRTSSTGYSTVEVAQVFGLDEQTVLSLLNVSRIAKFPEATASRAPVERIAERIHRFQCVCGATLVTNERTASCPNCGKNFGIRRTKHTRWKVDTNGTGQGVWRVGDIGNFLMYTTFCFLLFLWLYKFAYG